MLLRYVWDTKIPFCYDDDARRIIKKTKNTYCKNKHHAVAAILFPFFSAVSFLSSLLFLFFFYFTTNAFLYVFVCEVVSAERNIRLFWLFFFFCKTIIFGTQFIICTSSVDMLCLRLDVSIKRMREKRDIAAAAAASIVALFL